ncbi:NAD(P)-binding protein [Karstenula rhodostoma CBS 690.94]|uniref:NAD(P)-binding protein n=1 Tax=Karstenula rhodostoma CBS 690.94 TaxID=1392251 RepID=A0A9P4P9Q6_9PLEO|nr:NAD(P)-binding protein [Karstenula rhodostoma CBS 690.94]
MPPLTTLLSFYTSLLKSLLTLVFARLYTPQETPPRSLKGQTAIVTGANSGIGLSIAIALAKQGANVCLACRNADRGAAAVSHVVSSCDDAPEGHISCQMLDVGDLTSVRIFCENWDGEIDMLVHNAGIAAPAAGSAAKSREGLDVMYTTNFLGGFLMTHLLENKLAPNARVVLTSSTGSYSGASYFLQAHNEAPPNHRRSTPGVLARTTARVKALFGIAESSAPAYARSKAQQVLFASLLQSRFEASHQTARTAHAFTPGFTSTPIFDKFDVSWRTWLSNPLFAALKITEKWIAVDTDEGAKTGLWLALWGDEIGRNGDGGGYWERMERRTSFVTLMSERRKEREWNVWERDAGIVWNG